MARRWLLSGVLLTVGTAWAHADAPPLTVTASFGRTGSVSRADAVMLSLSRPVTPGEGRLAFLVGTTDWTDLFEVRGTSALFAPDAASLPAGATEVAAYLVTPAGEWRELGRFPLTVAAPSATTRAVKAVLDLAFKAQVMERHRPDDNAPARATFRDGSFQAAFESTGGTGDLVTRSELKIVGSTYRNEALRFDTRGEQAPRADLAAYGLEVGSGRARLGAGGLTAGGHPHLLNGFEGRGVRAVLPLGPPADLTLAAVSGSKIVGWTNPLGIGDGAHRILVGTLGIEAVPARPGALRLEASLLDGSVLPVASFGQGLVKDSAESRGFGVRLAGSDGSGRLRVGGSFARSRFLNAPDAELEAGLLIALEEPLAANARQARAEIDAVRAGTGSRLPFTLTLSAEHERLDPLYRSVGVEAQADLDQNAVGVAFALGASSLRLVHGRAHDNLGRVASILTTRTRRSTVDLALPLGSLAAAPSPWLPQVTYSLSRVHQAGEGVPPDSDFAPSHVPDQLDLAHAGSVQWQGGGVTLGYTVNVSTQDNRQPGRQAADFSHQTHGVAFAVAQAERLDLAVDAQLERSHNRELGERQRLRRLGLTLNRRLPRGFAFTTMVSASWTDRGDSSPAARNLEADAQASWRVSLVRGRRAPSATLFLRGATQRARLPGSEVLFGFDDRTAWQLHAGLNLSAF